MANDRPTIDKGQPEHARPPNIRRTYPAQSTKSVTPARLDRPNRARLSGTKLWTRLVLPTATVLIALLVFLFGPGIAPRIHAYFTQSDNAANLAASQAPMEQQLFHSTYSFRQAPFVHPRIVDDLMGNLADTGDQVIAINLLDSQDSNRYYGEILVSPQSDPMHPSWPWVYSLDGERSDLTLPNEFHGQTLYAYRYVGTTPNGLHVLHTRSSTGGASIFNRVLFVRTEADVGVHYPLSRLVDSGQPPARPEVLPRELLLQVGRIPLGDRWHGTIEVLGDEVVVRGRDLYERCEFGGVTMMEAVEMDYFMDIDCKNGAPERPPEARVFKAPITD